MLSRSTNKVQLSTFLGLDRSSNEFDGLDDRRVDHVSSFDTQTCDLVSEQKAGTETVSVDCNKHTCKMSLVILNDSDNVTGTESVGIVPFQKSSSPSGRVVLLYKRVFNRVNQVDSLGCELRQWLINLYCFGGFGRDLVRSGADLWG